MHVWTSDSLDSIPVAIYHLQIYRSCMHVQRKTYNISNIKSGMVMHQTKYTIIVITIYNRGLSDFPCCYILYEIIMVNLYELHIIIQKLYNFNYCGCVQLDSLAIHLWLENSIELIHEMLASQTTLALFNFTYSNSKFNGHLPQTKYIEP